MRSVVTHGLLSLATVGIYFLVWFALVNADLRRHRGTGSPPVWLLLLFLLVPVVGWFLAPLFSGMALRKVQKESESYKPTNALYPAIWGLVPVLGWAISGMILQAGANRAWDRFHRELERATTGPVTVECPDCSHRHDLWLNPFATNPIKCPQCGRAGEI